MDDLKKSSKNARQYKVSGDDYDHAHRRIMQYIQSAGFRARPGTQDRFGVDKDQRGLTWNRNIGNQADHELAHAIMTPVGESLREHQKKLGFASKQQHQGMTHEEAQAEEAAAFNMEDHIARRAGIRPRVRGTVGGATAYDTPARAIGRQNLNDFEQGLKTVDPKGKMVAGTSVDAKINARAQKMNMLKKEAPMWLGRHPVTDADHVAMLDREAATHEMGEDKLPKSEAEKKAYGEYIKDQRHDAAAWHLKGLKAAQAAGDREAAQKHAVMYAMHCKALGYEPVGQPHASIVARMEKHPDRLYRFKAHRGDLFALPDGNKGAEDPTKMDKSEKLTKHEIGHALLKALQELKKNYEDGDGDDFDRAEARHWWLTDHHGGQGSPEYAELLQSQYRPGAFHSGPSTDESKHLYQQMCDDAGCTHERLVPHEMFAMDGGGENPGGPPAPLRVVKAEGAIKAAKKKTCRCAAYKFPHRHSGGSCKGE